MLCRGVLQTPTPAGASLQLVPIIPRACSSIINLQYSITPSTCQAAQYKELKPEGEQGMIIEQNNIYF